MAKAKPSKSVKTPSKKPVKKTTVVGKEKTVLSKGLISINKIEKPFTKTELLSAIAEHACVSKAIVKNVLDDLSAIIYAHVKKNGPGQFTLPGLFKVKVAIKPASKAREGVNPLTGEKIKIKAKPARQVIRIKPLKALKDMV